MKTIYECVDLVEWQAQPHVETKQISPDSMLALITKYGLIDYLVDMPSYNETKAVKAAFNFGSEFNFIAEHPARITDLFAVIKAKAASASDVTLPNGTQVTCVQALELLEAEAISIANKTTYPNTSYTQERFDRERNKQSVESHTVTYTNGSNNAENAELSYHVKLSSKRVKAFVYVDEVQAFDNVFQLFAMEKPSENLPFGSPTLVGNIQVKAGELSGQLEITKNFTTMVQFKTVCDYQVAHQLVTVEA